MAQAQRKARQKTQPDAIEILIDDHRNVKKLFQDYAKLMKAEDNELMDEADVEHASAKDLIAQLEEMSAGDDNYDAKVTVLGELIDHHIKEEEGEMFPKTRKTKLDLASLGAQMAQRKEEFNSA